MALPKYKTSRANTHSRRANWKATAAQTIACPNCGAAAHGLPELRRLPRPRVPRSHSLRSHQVIAAECR